MKTSVNLYSLQTGEIQNFLNALFKKNIKLNNQLKWQNFYENPVEITDIIGTFIENKDKYNMNMWISLDFGIYILVTEHNADKIIRYIFERFPY